MEVHSIYFEPAGLRFTLITNSKWLSQYFVREYHNLLTAVTWLNCMTIVEKEVKGGKRLYKCRLTDDTECDTDNLSVVIVWLNKEIKKSYCFEEWWPFHSGMVIDSSGKSVLLCGHSGSGKTTMCVYLAQNGWTCVTDDLVWFDREGKLLCPMPVSFNIRDDVINKVLNDQKYSLYWFPDVNGNGRWIYPNQLDEYGEKIWRPTMIVLLLFRNNQKAEIRRMLTNESLETVLMNGYSSLNIPLNLDMSTKIVRQVPVYQLWYSDCRSGTAMIQRVLDTF